MLLLFFCLLSLLLCPGSAMTVMEALASRFDLITFTNFIRSANLSHVLDSGNHMVLVPTDKAFDRLPASYMAMLQDTKNPYHRHLIPDLVKYHIVPYTGQLDTDWTGGTVDTLLGKPVRIITSHLTNKTVVNGVIMKDANLSASNGHIFEVHDVLSPPNADIYKSLMRDDRFSTFLSAVSLAGMGSILKEDNITVLAPTNAAFQYLNENKTDKLFNNHAELQSYLHLYVVPDIYFTRALAQGQMIKLTMIDGFHVKLSVNVQSKNNVRIYPGPIPIAQADWLATNGVIQVLERVIIPYEKCHKWLL